MRGRKGRPAGPISAFRDLEAFPEEEGKGG